MELTIYTAKVVSIDVMYTDSRGVNVPMIYIQSDLDGAILRAPWLPVGAQQFMPKVGFHCVYFRVGMYETRIITFYGLNEDHIRKGENGLDEGEAVFQSDSGGGFLKVSSTGAVSLVTGDAVTSLDGDDTGWNMEAPQIILKTFGGGQFQLNEDGTVVFTRTTPDKTEQQRIEMDKDNNINMTCTGKIAMKAQKILLDGDVSFGPGATDPQKEAEFGPVVTAGPTGTYPLDFMTNLPIPGSSSVKSAG